MGVYVCVTVDGKVAAQVRLKVRLCMWILAFLLFSLLVHHIVFKSNSESFHSDGLYLVATWGDRIGTWVDRRLRSGSKWSRTCSSMAERKRRLYICSGTIPKEDAYPLLNAKLLWIRGISLIPTVQRNHERLEQILANCFSRTYNYSL